MTTTRRDIIRLASALGLAGALPPTAEGTPALSAEPATPTPATGRTTTYTMRGFLIVDHDDYGGRRAPLYYRELRFTVNHHEHWRDDTVDVIVTNPLRPEDAFDFTALRRQGLSGVLAEIDDYASEQARRECEAT